ncbi:MAG: MgtC/SapB family protein [candidate division Zixibacteria bacterium]|nr:MgtC/SapB family protein [candidate division Zixibacteria bacterium]
MNGLEIPFSLRFFIALGLAFLVGLERERSGIMHKGKVFAGVRTYSLIGVYGFGCAWLNHDGVAWALPMGMLSISALAIIGYLAKLKHGHVGWTSEVAALLTYIMGALTLMAEIWVPMALGIIGTFLLSEKSRIEEFVEHLDRTEFLAVVKFLVVTLIILPILPNQEYTEFLLNPNRIWRIVVLVSSLGFAGYFLLKKFGDRVGLWLSGILGGIVSSTAVSIAAGRMAQKSPDLGASALQASLLASSVMYLRILVLIWILKPEYVAQMWWQLVVLSGVGLALSFGVTAKPSAQPGENVQAPRNPFEIRPALVFAGLFVVLSLGTVMVTRLYGDAGLLALSGIIGVTDIDPFILSLVSQSQSYYTLMFAAIVLSMMSNTIAKGAYFAYLAKNVRRDSAWRYGLWAVLHIPIIWLIY